MHEQLSIIGQLVLVAMTGGLVGLRASKLLDRKQVKELEAELEAAQSADRRNNERLHKMLRQRKSFQWVDISGNGNHLYSLSAITSPTVSTEVLVDETTSLVKELEEQLEAARAANRKLNERLQNALMQLGGEP
jgi:hypothetical protein